MQDVVAASRKSSLLKLLKPPSPSLNLRNRYLRNLAKQLREDESRLLDIGSGGRKLIPEAINMDIERFENVNIVGDATRMPFKGNSFDFVVISAVLEHVEKPGLVVEEISRILTPGGGVYVENPFLQPFHADPNDFQRYTINGLMKLFDGFKVEDNGVCVGPCSAVAFFLRKLATVYITNGHLSKAVEYVVAYFTFWIKYFDLLFWPAKRLHIVASGLYVVLRKPSAD
jgi:SAM-dependent methyltransferase